MTAGVKFGSEKAKHRIDLQDEAVNSIFIPDELDEDWWAAVLADEPQIVNEIKPIQTILYEERESFKWLHPSPTIDWERVRTIFTNDEIVKMNVVSHNHGGILVASEDCHGFVPVSHLIDIPLELVDDDREQYLTHYLGRKVSLKVIECDPAKERIVFSERAALAKQGKRKALLHDLKEGDIIKGVVTNITKFGAFARLDDGIEGLPHISSMNFPAGGTHVDEFLFQDQPVRVCILNNDAHKRRLL